MSNKNTNKKKPGKHGLIKIVPIEPNEPKEISHEVRSVCKDEGEGSWDFLLMGLGLSLFSVLCIYAGLHPHESSILFYVLAISSFAIGLVGVILCACKRD